MLNLAECTRLYSGRPPRAWPGHPADPAASGVKLGQVSRVTGSGVRCQVTASPKVMKIFSHPQTRNQNQVVQNDKLSREYVETKIFVGGNCTFFHFLEKKLKKICEKISKKKFFFTKICFSGLEKAYVQLLVLNFFSDFDLQKLIFGNFDEFGLFFEVF